MRKDTVATTSLNAVSLFEADTLSSFGDHEGLRGVAISLMEY